MKKYLVILSILFILAGCTACQGTPSPDQDQDNSPDTQEKTEFSMEDLVVGNIKYGDSIDDVKAAFGEPASSTTHQEGATGKYITELIYADGNKFTFIKNTDTAAPVLRAVNIVTENIATAGDIEIGAAKDDVINSFKNENTNTPILYAAQAIKINESETILVPPRGFIADEPDENGRTEIRYDVPVKPYANQEETGNFVYQEHGSITFFIKDDKVDEYSWFVGAMAE